MKNLSDKDIKKALDHPVFHLIGDTADELNLECYVIGGWVRDLFLERPSKDIDIVVAFKNPNDRRIASEDADDQEGQGSRPGIMLAEALRKKLKKAHIAIYRNFGTAQLKSKGVEIEFVGARKESYDRN